MWVRIQLHMIDYWGDKATLIKIPNSKFKFWISNKLVRQSFDNMNVIEIKVWESFKTVIFRSNKLGMHLEEKEITGYALAELFGVDVDAQSKIDKLKPIEIIEDLRDD